MAQTAGPKPISRKITTPETICLPFDKLPMAMAPNKQKSIRDGREARPCEWCEQRIYTTFKGIRIEYEHPDSDEPHKCSTLLPTQVRELNFQRERKETRYWKEFKAAPSRDSSRLLYLSGESGPEVVGLRTSHLIDFNRPVFFARRLGLIRFLSQEGQPVVSSIDVEGNSFGNLLDFHVETDPQSLPELRSVRLFGISQTLCIEIASGMVSSAGNGIALRSNSYFNIAETDHLRALGKDFNDKVIGLSAHERMLVRKKKYILKLKAL
jgi:hypothetical protein